MPVIELVTWRLGDEPSPRQQDLQYFAILKGDPCSYCGGLSDVADHIVAQWMGGEDGWTNRTAACRACNARKSARTMLAMLSGLAVGDDHREKEKRRLAAWRARQAML